MDSKLQINIIPQDISKTGHYRLYLNSELLADRKCSLPPAATQQHIFVSSELQEQNDIFLQNLGETKVEIVELLIDGALIDIEWLTEHKEAGKFIHEN